VKDDSFISAGELEKFGYCPLNWWRSRQDSTSTADTEAGIEKHANITNGVEEIIEGEHISVRAERSILWFAVGATIIALMGITFMDMPLTSLFSRILVILALIWLLAASFLLYGAESVTTKQERMTFEKLMLVFAMVAVVLAVYAVTFILQPDTTLSRVLEVLALVWLIGASFFLFRSMYALDVAQSTRKKFGIQEGNIEYVDSHRAKSELLSSEKYKLRGRPDYILTINEDLVPVEVKTGRTPQGPLFSHILQLAAYCILVEEKYRKTPPYGILKYSKMEHQIEFDEDLRQLVNEKLDRMKNIMRKGEAHRNHKRLGKCTSCSRRAGCPERLDE
jgi:CRISPR-associated exonuclease Cas4